MGRVFSKLEAIAEFGAGRPSEFGLCDPDMDLAMMQGFLSVKSKMKRWEDHLAEKRAEEVRRKHKK